MTDQRQFSRQSVDTSDFMYPVESQIRYRLKNLFSLFAWRPAVAAVKNVSAEGLCFVSNRRLKPGDRLDMELCLPGFKEVVRMEGEARWSAQSAAGEKIYDTGVRVKTVSGKSVPETVYFDQTYHLYWSAVLESILGRFRVLQRDKQ
ncbi:MAG: PilZ domain-containing protein [Candidatus Omnitrophica bacterium]|nr:PilZ domain-containing protein [Candidatus Omnitrophota bacterium]